jgi:hypothetical protein
VNAVRRPGMIDDLTHRLSALAIARSVIRAGRP